LTHRESLAPREGTQVDLECTGDVLDMRPKSRPRPALVISPKASNRKTSRRRIGRATKQAMNPFFKPR
jgi:hypothetical protein